MIYKCSKREDICDARAYVSLELNPADYLFCENEDDLMNTVEEDLQEAVSYGDIIVYDRCEMELIIPKGFIDEWLKLKKEHETNKE